MVKKRSNEKSAFFFEKHWKEASPENIYYMFKLVIHTMTFFSVISGDGVFGKFHFSYLYVDIDHELLQKTEGEQFWPMGTCGSNFF